MAGWELKGQTRGNSKVVPKAALLDGLPPTVLREGLRLLGRQKLEQLMGLVGLVGTMRRIHAARQEAAARSGVEGTIEGGLGKQELVGRSDAQMVVASEPMTPNLTGLSPEAAPLPSEPTRHSSGLTGGRYGEESSLALPAKSTEGELTARPPLADEEAVSPAKGHPAASPELHLKYPQRQDPTDPAAAPESHDAPHAFATLNTHQGGAGPEHPEPPADLPAALIEKSDSEAPFAPGNGPNGGTADQSDAPMADGGSAAAGSGSITDEVRRLVATPRAVTARLERVSFDDAIRVIYDPELMSLIQKSVSAQQWDRISVALAHGLEAREAAMAFEALKGDKTTTARRLALFGTVAQQRALCNATILHSDSNDTVEQAFHCYWSVECTKSAGVTTWPVPILRSIHQQLKELPSQDARNGVWRQLERTNDPKLSKRAAYGHGVFYLGSEARTDFVTSMGYGTKLHSGALAGATTLQVVEGYRFAVGDSIAIDEGPSREVRVIKSIADNTYTVEPSLKYAHAVNAVLARNDATGTRSVNWLTASVRHEIAHSVDAALGGVKSFTRQIGGWWTGDDFDQWANAMGSPWATNDKSTISEDDKKAIKAAIVAAVGEAKQGSLQRSVPREHPIRIHWNKAVPVIVAADACLSRGDKFYTEPEALFGANNKRFSISQWYRRFMYCNEEVLTQRVSDYSLYSPAEFFAECYTVFYEEAGKPGLTEADYGRLLRTEKWRSWIREEIHDRGHAPSGASGAGGGKGEGATAHSAGSGKQSGDPE